MKHAIVIAGHGNLSVLKRCIQVMDDQRFDFYIHIDAKSKDSGLWLKDVAKSSNVFLTKRIPVYWGHHSQVHATILLLKEALQHSVHYNYYHFLSSSCMPLKTPEEIDLFFTQNQGTEFVNIRETTEKCGWRMQYRYPLLTWIKRTKYPLLNNIQKLVYTRLIRFPRKPGTSILRDKKWPVYMGDNWFSITRNLAVALTQIPDEILDLWKDCYVSDETFVQTLIMNMPELAGNRSDFKTRAIDWGRGRPYTWQLEDIDSLLETDALFARKFDPENLQAVEALFHELIRRKTLQ